MFLFFSFFYKIEQTKFVVEWFGFNIFFTFIYIILKSFALGNQVITYSVERKK
jgi:hypothetical protein